MIVPVSSKARQVLDLRCLTFITVQVSSAINVRLGHSQNSLDTPGPLGEQDGIVVNNTTLVMQLWWLGELWVASDTDGSFVIEAPTQPGSNVQR